MTALIARLRLLVSDPTGTPVFTDDQLQDFLDKTRDDVRYLELRAEPTLATAAPITWLDYYDTQYLGDWEADVVLVNGAWVTVTPATSDLLTGHWTFAQSQVPPVFLIGKTYDLHRAAADVLEAWAGNAKLCMDFKVGDESFTASQKQAQLRDLAKAHRRQQRRRSVRLRRSDSRAVPSVAR